MLLNDYLLEVMGYVWYFGDCVGFCEWDMVFFGDFGIETRLRRFYVSYFFC
jgi:hypothetical protein